jgi:hypothetical protein
MTVTHIVTLPAYYPLYALYTDYLINNLQHARLEDMERVREALRVIAPLLGLEQPYRKTWALRLFTERQALGSYPPELVDEAWRQVRQWVEHWGPPPDWPTARHQQQHRVLRRRPSPPTPEPEPGKASDFFPRSPVDYDQEA